MTPRRTWMPTVTMFRGLDIDIDPVFENMIFSYLAQNHSSVTELETYCL